MFGENFWFFVPVIVCLGSSMVYAEICEEDREIMMSIVQPYIEECVEEFGYTEEEVEDFKKEENFGNIDPCFFSCFFKKTRHFDSDGMYDGEKASDYHWLINDEDDRAKMDNMKKVCARVNDEEVTDGDKGCERASLLIECFMEQMQ